MPFQLIYTSAPQLLDSASSGYGTVACSEKLSKSLRSRLAALSVYREPRGKAATRGPQFSYHVFTHGGTLWHVLTCAQLAGADYSGRNSFLAHHLILSQDEITALNASAMRITPAGVCLALSRKGFWVNKWQGEPRYLSGVPALSPGDVPDASTQPTWKKITGHKSNARAFFTSPFQRECLITFESATTSADILHLFHESDWLTHTHGWGTSFTTEADDADSFSETHRMVTGKESPLVQRAIRTGRPILFIAPDMELPMPELADEPPVSEPVRPDSGNKPSGSILQSLARNASHYQYTEEPDWLLYDVGSWRRPRFLSVYTAAFAGAAACVGLALWLVISAPGSQNTTVDTEGAEVADSSAVAEVEQLAALLNAPYNHGATQELISKLSSISDTGPESAILLETVVLIQNARVTTARHAANLKRLCECARLLGLKDADLALLYLREATHKITPEEWHEQFDGNQATDWYVLKQQEPQLVGLMSTPELQPYAPGNDADIPETTILATANDAPPTEEEDGPEEQTATGRISLIPAAAVAGSPLPKELEQAIPQLPLSVSAGNYAIARFASGGDLEPSQQLQLSADGYRLYITPTENAGEFLIKPEHKEGKPSPVPAATFTVRNGRLHSIRCGNSEAAICFPVPVQENFHTRIVLSTAFGVPVPRGKGITLPPASNAGLTITHDSLQVVAPTEKSGSAAIRLRKKKGFPWELSRKEIEKIRFTLNLPVLAGHNSMEQTGEESPLYVWKDSQVSKETDTRSTLKCEIEHRPDIPGRLERAFERVANSPCCGEIKSRNAGMTLGNLYYICTALENEKLSRREKRELFSAYFALFAHKQFNKILLRIFAQDTILHITPEEAGSNKIKALKIRNDIKKHLETKNVRAVIRQRIHEVLTRTLYAAYTQEQQILGDKAAPSPVLLLDKISAGDHVELLWQFRLQTGTK